MYVKDCMNTQVEVVSSDSFVDEAAKKMFRNMGAIAVMDDTQLLGTITERDIVDSIVAGGKNPAGTLVSEIMYDAVISCTEDQSVEEAIHLMALYQMRRLPVVDLQGYLMGMIAHADIAKEIEKRELQNTMNSAPFKGARLAIV